MSSSSDSTKQYPPPPGPPPDAAVAAARAAAEQQQQQQQQYLQKQQQQEQLVEDTKPDEQKLKEQVEPIIKTYVDLQRELSALRNASPTTSDADWTAFGKKVDAASSALKIVATAVEKYKSIAPTNTDDPKTTEEINKRLSELREESGNLSGKGIQIPQDIYEEISRLKGMLREIDDTKKKKGLSEVPPTAEQFAQENALRNDESRTINEFAERDAARSGSAAVKTRLGKQDGGSSSSSKKNRKSYKSYHPEIGKTRKHHSHDEHKRVSFVHQA